MGEQKGEQTRLIQGIENFKNRCSQHHSFVFYGASKDLVQLIESLDILLEKQLNFDLIIDDDIEGRFDSIYDINSTSYKPDGKILPSNRKVNIKNSKVFFEKDFDKKKHIIITTSDAKKNLYFSFLNKSKLYLYVPIFVELGSYSCFSFVQFSCI